MVFTWFYKTEGAVQGIHFGRTAKLQVIEMAMN